VDGDCQFKVVEILELVNCLLSGDGLQLVVASRSIQSKKEHRKRGNRWKLSDCKCALPRFVSLVFLHKKSLMPIFFLAKRARVPSQKKICK